MRYKILVFFSNWPTSLWLSEAKQGEQSPALHFFERKQARKNHRKVSHFIIFTLLLNPSLSAVSLASKGSCIADIELSARMGATEKLAPSAIEYRRMGQPSKPTVILIPGNTETCSSFGPIMERLAEQFDVIAYSQRGHGRTPALGMNYSSEQLAADLLGLMDFLGVRKAHLVGHSLGARTALRAAALAGDRVLSITVEDFPATPVSFDSRLHSASLASQLMELPEIFESKGQAVSEVGAILDADWTDRLVSQFGMELDRRRFKFSVSLPVYLLYGSQAGSENQAPLLAQIHPPILVVGADPQRGGLLTAEHIQKWRDNKVQVVPVLSAGHYVHRDSPKEFTDTLIPFLSRVPSI